MEQLYKVMGKTNGWIASRDVNFRGKCEVTFAKGLTLRKAQKELLAMYNNDYNTCWSNWGLAVIHSNGNAWSGSDGVRRYEHDSRVYWIEEDNDKQLNDNEEI